jgi:hypothetical protein
MRRRRRLRSAVLGVPERLLASDGPSPRAVEGRIVDATPHLLVLWGPSCDADDADGADGHREYRVPLTERTSVWHGGRAGTEALQPGREAVVRPTSDGLAADRIWVDITRVNGTILSVTQRRERHGAVHLVEVDQGPHRPHVRVAIPPENLGKILVRHPLMLPGQLFDVIARQSWDGPVAVQPGTAQPAPLISPPPGPEDGLLRGTATWCPVPGRGAVYPRLEPLGDSGGCPDAPEPCAELPYLSLGSALEIRNDCTGRSADLDVVECGCNAALFCDRCVECGTSPRGRLVELTRASFVELGGNLDAGCFNATLAVNR